MRSIFFLIVPHHTLVHCLAYLLPLLNRIAHLPMDARRGYGLILLPSGDLVRQVGQVINEYGQDITQAAAVLRGNFHLGPNAGIVLSTPGQLKQFNYADILTNTKVVVLDEADLLLSGSFVEQIKVFIYNCPTMRTFLRVEFLDYSCALFS